MTSMSGEAASMDMTWRTGLKPSGLSRSEKKQAAKPAEASQVE